MDRVPPEIWEQILKNLLDSTDSINATKTTVLWRNILHFSRSSWLFSEIFPLLLIHFSKRDVLACRLVCKHWRHGVDHFLENNAFQRPPLGNSCQRIYTQYRSDQIGKILRDKNLSFHGCQTHKAKQKMLLSMTASNLSTPIVGKSVIIKEPQPLLHGSMGQINLEYLQTFGEHIYFLFIDIVQLENHHQLDTLRRILELTCFVPNLKKLTVSVSGLPVTDDDSEDHLQRIIDYVEGELDEGHRKQFPRVLETLEISSNRTSLCYEKMTEILCVLLVGENIKSLTLNPAPSLLPDLKKAERLIDLNLGIKNVSTLAQLECLNVPLEKLEIQRDLYCDMRQLFPVVSCFRKSLQHFQLTLCSRFCPVSEYSELEPFRKWESLCNFSKLNRITIRTIKRISLNFLWGLRHCLEYLHIYAVNVEVWERENVTRRDLNLMNYVKTCAVSRKKLEMFKSNVWEFFPGLRLLTVAYCQDSFGNERESHEYTREIYDKLHSNK